VSEAQTSPNRSSSKSASTLALETSVGSLHMVLFRSVEDIVGQFSWVVCLAGSPRLGGDRGKDVAAL